VIGRLAERTTRAIEVLRARFALHRAAPLARLRATQDLDELIDQAFAASARNLAVASAFLPRDVRRVGAVSFLACRALDAFEDLSPDLAGARRDVSAAADYLAGRSSRPPEASHLRAPRPTDQIEAILSGRLPLLRAAIERLPNARQAEVTALVDRIGAAMVEAIGARERGEPVDRRRYGSTVLGDAVAYAVRLVGGTIREDFARAAGCVLQFANDIRDTPSPDVLAELALGVAMDAPQVPRLLDALRFPARSGARGAILYLALTSTRFLLRNAGTTPRPLRASLALAVAAVFSVSSYRRTVRLLERWIHLAPALVLLRYVRGERAHVDDDALAVSERPRGRAFAAFLATLHPDPDAAEALIAATWLGEQAGYFLRHVPEGALTDELPARRTFLLAGDHLLGCAVNWIAPLGPSSTRMVGETMVRTAVLAQATGGHADPSAELAHGLSRIATGAQGRTKREAEILGAVHTELARALGTLDRAVTRSSFRAARTQLDLTLDRVERLAQSAPTEIRAHILHHQQVATAIAARRD
jgi:hypothetical protein